MSIDQENEDIICFKSEESAILDSNITGAQPWLVLVVDDEEDIHSVTSLMMLDLYYNSRPVQLLHAYSASEALSLLKSNPEVALILLDVVMESEHAGLELVHHIRSDLCYRNVRIVLRTGHPGLAPERSVMLEYDIDDYRAKTELTSDRMFSTVISSLRTFDKIMAYVREREAREKADQAAAAQRAAMAALEKRKADERRVELDAIAQHLEYTLLPNILDAAEQARLLCASVPSEGPAAPTAHILTIGETWEKVCEALNELLETLRDY